MKLLVSMMTTVGYGTVASAFIDPVTKGVRFTPNNYLAIAAALVFLATALYLVPEGERDDGS